MKFVWFLLLVAGLWIWRDWQRVRRVRERLQRRAAARGGVRAAGVALECQLANGEIDEARFRMLRDEAFRRLQEAVGE